MDQIKLPALMALAAIAAFSAPARSETPIIPRDVLFGSPDRAGAQISPDGSRLAYLAPVEGVLNIWVGPVTDPKAAKAMTHLGGSGVTQYFWAQDNQHLLYLKDKDGDENHHIFSLPLAGGEAKDLTPFAGVRAQVMGVSSRHPEEILVQLNNRNPALHDVHRLNIRTGAMTLVHENPGYLGYLADEDYALRFAIAQRPEGGQEILRRGDDGTFTSWTVIPREDEFNTGPAGIDSDGTTLYMFDSRGRNTSVLTAIDLATGKETVVAEDPRADAENLMLHPTTGKLRAVSFNYDRRSWKVLDPSVALDFDYLRTVADGEVLIGSTSVDDQRWIVAYMMDNGPVQYYLYDRPAKKATLLFTNREALEGQPLTKMHCRTIKTRDGLDMVGYLSLPLESDPDGDGIPSKPVPMILQVHGGPWYRDNWGYNPYHQWAANRGYAILAVQFRGSTGFGKAFLNASNGEWGGKMHDDLLDAVDWAVKSGIAPRDKVAIMGGSYGGYSVLWGLTNTPKTFACGVDIFGVSSLVTMLESFPAYWGPVMEIFYQRIGDPRTAEGRKFLESRSPLTYAEKIERPLLIVHGANDVRVRLAESDQLVAAMKKNRTPVTYVVYPDEGHLTFFHPQNNISCYAIAEQFLKQHLGGRAEPIGNALKGASLETREGADDVPGLREAINVAG
ncbi:MAG: S9 family peptidase [Candidatus Eisenbacteria bacterium]|nr:S9 family peptidase [Candidatus Eisenbacteria bacterium]